MYDLNGLLMDVMCGVADFFYEPAIGLVKSPQEFGLGLAKGSLSLLKNTFTSVFGAAAKITSSIGKGVAFLSFNDEFIEEQARSSNEVSNSNSNVATGFAKGMFSLGKGIVGGIGGLVLDPLKGAKQEGALGFAKGMAKGVVGIVTKPTAGAIEAAAQTIQGIGNTANIFDSKTTLDRIRPQRFIDNNTKIVTVYNLQQAIQLQNIKQNKKKENKT